MSETYHLLLSANKAFMEQMVVCMSSILRNNQGKSLHFHILHSEIDNEILEQVKNWMKRESAGGNLFLSNKFGFLLFSSKTGRYHFLRNLFPNSGSRTSAS